MLLSTDYPACCWPQVFSYEWHEEEGGKEKSKQKSKEERIVHQIASWFPISISQSREYRLLIEIDDRDLDFSIMVHNSNKIGINYEENFPARQCMTTIE